ncbi:MAG: hypothetical protein V8S20_05070 [Candidatus Gastranaerophilaceae bacterium]|jgi:hypothetical protein|nr:hypothetical protein [bacterium]MEE0496360.1 hypothetical protein [Cyanobacteriota bacterium]CDE91435.1 unknown [Fusobacterium sp. CAG:815]DAA91471.1 MAG TPA: hypothetical protein CPT93_07870 [Candidatus Gastranaerophilales bacterium HUM_7]DAA92993.1 MAG TPA: hypothetical protein CPT79_02335 [Candidatus Gastranaerophilales bacterium HUM_6]DAB02938.1 MAG TPA: hypothetical protein CPT84_03710 [Candidatus Gastranaerophilales bacterium HUM_12]DAB04945.1 MAG TPA: hypothetical protein CPT78_0828
MRKRFWKIEYSITIFVVFGIILLLLPSSFITSKEATYITKWNDTYNKVDYTFTAMSAQADANIIKSFHNAKTNDEREKLMLKLVKPYLRINSEDEVTEYSQFYMNSSKVQSNDLYHFDNLYNTNGGIIVGIKDIKDNDAYHPGFIMMFDMNGKKGPNTWGKDIYGINIFSDGKITPIGSGWNIKDVKNDCSEHGSGVSCSYYYRIGGEFNE